MYVLILAICFNKFALFPSHSQKKKKNNIIDFFLKAIKNFIDLKSIINLTNSTTKFINSKLKPKQHPKINQYKTNKK